MKIRDLSEKGVLFVAQIRGKGGCFLTLEHEYVPFLGPRGGLGIVYVPNTVIFNSTGFTSNYQWPHEVYKIMFHPS